MRTASRCCVHARILTMVLGACGVGSGAMAQAQAQAQAPAPSPQPAASSAAVVEQPRPFGYTLGDIATQRVLLSRGGRAFEPGPLPGPARANAWLERRGARVERAPDGSRWLAVEYQLVNAPRALTTVSLPGWDLAGAPGTPPLHVPAAALSVAPLTAPVAPGQALPLRPDRPAPLVDTASIERRLRPWVAALAACLAGWLGYAAWNGWRASRTQPFARALRELRGQPASTGEAHLALHHAFDRTAEQIVHAGTLGMLFERAPHLQPLRPQIEGFYAQSAALFFGNGLPAGALSPQALCRRLRRLERRHAR